MNRYEIKKEIQDSNNVGFERTYNFPKSKNIKYTLSGKDLKRLLSKKIVTNDFQYFSTAVVAVTYASDVVSNS